MNILVAIDELDPSCHHHLEIATQLARAYGGGLIAFHAAAAADLVHAGRTLQQLAGGVSSEVAAYGESGRAMAILEAADRLTRAGVPSEGLVVPNYAGLADELAQAADRLDADVIVIGSSGKLDLAQWMLGSIAEAVLHRSRRPVLVVPNLTL